MARLLGTQVTAQSHSCSLMELCLCPLCFCSSLLTIQVHFGWMDGKARAPPQYYRPYYMMWLYAGTCGLVPIIVCMSTIFLQQQSWSKICGVRFEHATFLEACHQRYSDCLFPGGQSRAASLQVTLLPYCVALFAQMIVESAFMRKGGLACDSVVPRSCLDATRITGLADVD